jgi:hypothetical protein
MEGKLGQGGINLIVVRKGYQISQSSAKINNKSGMVAEKIEINFEECLVQHP